MILLSNKVEFYASLPVFKAVFIAVQAQYLLAQSKTHTAGIITTASCLIVTVKHVPQIFLIFLLINSIRANIPCFFHKNVLKSKMM